MQAARETNAALSPTAAPARPPAESRKRPLRGPTPSDERASAKKMFSMRKEVNGDAAAAACAIPPAAASPPPQAAARAEFAKSLADLPEKFAAMIYQDSGVYRCGDYLLLAEIEKAEAQARAEAEAESEAVLRVESPSGAADFPLPNDPRDSLTRSRRLVQPEWREKMAEWSYQVVDYYAYDREVVAASMSLLDRYVSTYGGAINMRRFQLLAVATLFLSLKLQPGLSPDGSRPRCGIPVSHLADLSRGFFDEGRVAEAEMVVLMGLGWRVHPPTAAAFLRHLFYLLPLCHGWAVREVEERATFLVELSVLDGGFIPKRRSSIALAALLEALEKGAIKLSDEAENEFYESVGSVAGLDPDDGEVAECRARLRGVIYANGYEHRNVDMTFQTV